MPIEGAPWFVGDGAVTLTKLPRPGRVLVSSSVPPAIPGDRCVDVRPGSVASFDGNRVRLPLLVRCEDERRRFDRRELPDLEATVATMLRTSGVETVRFGDRVRCRGALSTAAVEAIERRLSAAVCPEGATLVTWTGDAPRNEDYRTYDVVVEGPVVRFG